MHRLVYYSANRIDGPETEFAGQVEQILEASRRNNAMVGVTGALMVSDGYFGQVLEGPQAAIEATFERIQQDPRHGDVLLLEFREIEGRSFDSWAMAYVGRETGVLSNLAEKTGYDDSRVIGEQLFHKLRDMVADTGAAA